MGGAGQGRVWGWVKREGCTRTFRWRASGEAAKRTARGAGAGAAGEMAACQTRWTKKVIRTTGDVSRGWGGPAQWRWAWACVGRARGRARARSWPRPWPWPSARVVAGAHAGAAVRVDALPVCLEPRRLVPPLLRVDAHPDLLGAHPAFLPARGDDVVLEGVGRNEPRVVDGQHQHGLAAPDDEHPVRRPHPRHR